MSRHEECDSSVKAHSVKYLAAEYLAADTPFEVLEGENVEGVFLAEWPSMQAAKALYDSPGHKAIRHVRRDNAEHTVVLETGAAPPEERFWNRIR